jgi:hypothetical protein
VTLLGEAGSVIDGDGPEPHVLVIAVWREQDGLRARVTYSSADDPTGRRSVGVAARDRVLEVVADWLAHVEAKFTDDEA